VFIKIGTHTFINKNLIRSVSIHKIDNPNDPLPYELLIVFVDNKEPRVFGFSTLMELQTEFDKFLEQ